MELGRDLNERGKGEKKMKEEEGDKELIKEIEQCWQTKKDSTAPCNA